MGIFHGAKKKIGGITKAITDIPENIYSDVTGLFESTGGDTDRPDTGIYDQPPIPGGLDSTNPNLPPITPPPPPPPTEISTEKKPGLSTLMENEIRKIYAAYGEAVSDADMHDLLVQLVPALEGEPGNASEIIKNNKDVISAGITNHYVSNKVKTETIAPTVTPEHTGHINEIFNDVLGRNPTKRETDFYSKELAKGESPYEVEQGLQTSPEYLRIQSDKENTRVKAEAQAARDQLSQQLSNESDEAFRRAFPQIMSAYMAAGRLPSSGLDNAIARARADIDREKQATLARVAFEDAARQSGYRREDFLGSQARGYADYLRQNEPAFQNRLAAGRAGNFLNYQNPLNLLQRQYGLSDQATQRQYALEDYATRRANELTDYSMQRNDYNDMLNRQYRQQKRLLPYQLLGQVLGGATTALSGFGLSKLIK